MPHQALKILPGVDTNKTPALNEAAISESQLVRFIPDRTLGGLVQQLGGWSKYPPSNVSFMGSIVRSLWAWEDTNNNSYLGVGCEGLPSGGGKTLQVVSNAISNDITPKILVVNDSIVDVQTTYGINAVTIVDSVAIPREITSNDTVYIKNPISVGGLVLFGLYQCYNPGGSSSQYTIYASSNAVLPASITSGSTDGTTATLNYSGTYEFAVGDSVVVSGTSPSVDGTHVVTASAPGTVSFASAVAAGAVTGGSVVDVPSVPYFETEANSNNVTITLNNHGYEVGDTFAILINVSVGGISLYGNYTVTEKLSTSQFVITSFISASSTDAVYENNDLAWYVYYKGQNPNLSGIGYGVNGYGGSGTPTSGYGGSVDNPLPPAYPGTPINAIDWTLDNWGEDFISCPFDGAIYQWSPTQGQQIAVVIPEAPPVNEGMFVAMPQRQIVAWGSTFNGIKDPLLIRYCDVDNYNDWILSPTNQAGSYRIPKGSHIIQCIQGPQQGLVWTDLGVWAMQYVGQPFVYQFSEIGTGCGLIGRKAAGSVNGVVYWMGQSQFYRLSGGGVEPIRCPIWDVVFQDLDTTNLNSIRIAPNSRFGEIAWYYPTNGTKNITNIVGDGSAVTVTFNDVGIFVVGSTVTIANANPPAYNGAHVVTSASAGSVTFASGVSTAYISGGTISGSFENSAYVKYNYVLDQWDYGSNTTANPYVSRSAWINESVLGPPIGAGLNQYLYQHETSQNADGSAMNSYFQTGYFALTEADVLMFIDQVWPDMKWGYFGGTQSANILLTFFVTSYPNEPPVQYGPYTWGVLTSATKYITPRFRGRLVSIRIESNEINSWWRLGNIRYRIQADGKFL